MYSQDIINCGMRNSANPSLAKKASYNSLIVLTSFPTFTTDIVKSNYLHFLNGFCGGAMQLNLHLLRCVDDLLT